MIDEKKLIKEIEKEIDGVILIDTYTKGKNAGLRKAKILAREQIKIGEWIPCSERLPEKSFSCLVTIIDSRFNGSYFEDFENILPYFVGYSDGQWNDSDGEKIPFEVTAWMPVPKEPYHDN